MTPVNLLKLIISTSVVAIPIQAITTIIALYNVRGSLRYENVQSAAQDLGYGVIGAAAGIAVSVVVVVPLSQWLMRNWVSRDVPAGKVMSKLSLTFVNITIIAAWLIVILVFLPGLYIELIRKP